MFWRQQEDSQKSRAIAGSPASDLESRTQEIGRELLAACRANRGSTLWSEKLISWALSDERFKTELFRFVDVFPVLKTPEAIHRHLIEYVQEPGVQLPTGMSIAIKAGGLLKGTFAHTVTSQITAMAQRFIAGRDVPQAAADLEAQWKQNIGFSVDLLGEACVSHAEAAAYREKYLSLIDRLSDLASGWSANGQLEQDHLGAIP